MGDAADLSIPTKLIAQKDFIEFNRPGSFGSYKLRIKHRLMNEARKSVCVGQ